MKRQFFAKLMLLILALLCSCADTRSNISDKTLNQYLITQSIDLTCTMDSLAQSEEYITLFSTPPELSDFMRELSIDEYTTPSKAVLIRISDEIMISIIEEYAGNINLPDDAYEMLVTRMLSSVPYTINARQEVNIIAATSMLSINKAFQQHKDFTDNTYVILLYDNCCSVTCYRKSGESIVSASTMFLFLPDDMKRTLTEETVEDYLSEQLGIVGIEIEYIGGNIIAEYK